MSSNSQQINIGLVGAGSWSQSHHLPQLKRNPDVNIAAIVKRSLEASGPDQDSLPDLAEKYDSSYFQDAKEMFDDESIGPELDGVMLATPHTTHYGIGQVLLDEAKRRIEAGEKPLHILMEKPVTANVDEAQKLHKLVTDYKEQGGKGCFIINHSANFRSEAIKARELVESGAIGEVQHISAFFASPLFDLFDNPENKGWTQPSGDMRGNGFGWGQQAHLLGWIFHVCPDLTPAQVYCQMVHSKNSGADIAHSATVTCSSSRNGQSDDNNNVVMSISGTAMLPGGAHKEEPTGKLVRIMMFGSKGAIIYSGDDRDPSSGQLELRLHETNGDIETPAGDEFHFENIEKEGVGPESLQNFIQACKGEDFYQGADSLLGLRTIQVLDAMYRSNDTKQPEEVKAQKLDEATVGR